MGRSVTPEGTSRGYTVSYKDEGWQWVAWDGPRTIRGAAHTNHQAHTLARAQLAEWALLESRISQAAETPAHPGPAPPPT